MNNLVWSFVTHVGRHRRENQDALLRPVCVSMDGGGDNDNNEDDISVANEAPVAASEAFPESDRLITSGKPPLEKTDMFRGGRGVWPSRAWAEQWMFAAVADGMGGHPDGALASRLALQAFLEELRHLDRQDGGGISPSKQPKSLVRKQALEHLIRRAHEVVFNANRARLAPEKALNEREWMGSTLVAACLGPGQKPDTGGASISGRLSPEDQQAQGWAPSGIPYTIGWCGDSRVYHWKHYAPGRGSLEQKSIDHTCAQMNPAHGFSFGRHAQVIGPHVLKHVLGLPDCFRCDTARGVLAPGDRLLLCSDGLTHEVNDSVIADIFGDGGDVHQVAENLLSAALEAGGHDNTTIGILAIE